MAYLFRVYNQFISEGKVHFKLSFSVDSVLEELPQRVQMPNEPIAWIRMFPCVLPIKKSSMTSSQWKTSCLSSVTTPLTIFHIISQEPRIKSKDIEEFATAQILRKAKNILPESIQNYLATGREGGYNIRGKFNFTITFWIHNNFLFYNLWGVIVERFGMGQSGNVQI